MSAEDPVRIDELLAHRAWVRGLARSLVLDESRADDLEQETWLRALGKAPSDRRSLRAWLARVVKSAWIDSHRSERQRGVRERASARPEAARDADVVARLDTHRRVVQLVHELEEPYRTTLLLRYFEGLSERETAARLGVSVETVHTRVRRALARMRERLDAQSGGDRDAWCAALGPLALWSGGVAMKTSAKVALVAALFVAAAAGTLHIASRTPVAPAEEPADVAAIARGADPARPRPGEAPETEAAPVAADTTSALAGDVLAPDGRPAARASVRAVRLTSDPRTKSPAATASADADGRFAFAKLAPGDYALDASAPGVGAALLPRVRIDAATPARVTIRLEREAAVTGRVVAEEDGAPLVGATVTTDAMGQIRTLLGRFRAGTPGADASREALTGEDGAFRLAPLLAGACTLTVSAKGRIARTCTVRAPAADVVVPLTRGGTLSAVVTALGDPPPAELLVTVWGRLEDERHAATGRETRLVIDGLPAGDTEIVVRAVGHGLARATARIVPGRETQAPPLVLEAPVEVRGVVREADTDRPVEGAEVALMAIERTTTGASGRQEATVRTDASGAWSAPLRTGEWRLTASKPGYLLPADAMDDGGATLHVTRETREAVLRLRPAPSIVGRVEYQDGSPAADSKVAVVAVGANADVPESGTVGIWPEEEEVEAGSDGAFRFVGAPVHQSYDLEARGPSGERARAHRVVFEKGKLETEVRIRLERGAAGGVEGRVVDESGRPIEAALVAVTATGGHSGFGVFTSEEPHTVVTDALGRFHVDPVSVGTVRVVVGALGRAPRALPDVAVAAGGTTKVPDVVLRTRGLSVHGRLTDAAGRPVTGAEVWTSFSMSADGSSMSTTSGGVGPDGTWFVDGPDSEGQEVTVYFRAPGFSYTTRTLAVRGDAVLDVVMTREAALEVAVTFDGPPPATVVVERRERGSWQRLPTTWDAAARTARASQVWVGIDAIRLRADGFAPGGLQEITVPDGGTVVAKAVRLTPGGTLEGRVLDAGGRPLGGVQVSCDEWFVFVDTAEDGRFRLPHLPPGTWTFSIHAVPGREERPSPQFAAAIDEGGTTQVEWRVGP